MTVDYRRKVTMPIRDLGRDGEVYCLVDVYGVTPSDIATVGGDIGSAPFVKAVKRLGLNPHRYQAWLFDVPV